MLKFSEIFPEKCIKELLKVKDKKCKNFTPIIEKYLTEINSKTNQENDLTYLGYMAEYFLKLGGENGK
jgi:hypothetical protein